MIYVYKYINTTIIVLYKMSKDIFYQFLDEKLKNIQDDIWFTSIIFYEIYKDKYCFKCFNQDLWIHNLDKSITNEHVIDCIINDITSLNNELLLYNEIRQNKDITIITSKINDDIFIKSVIRELRELFYMP